MGEKGLGYRLSQTKESYDNLLVCILIKNFLNEFETHASHMDKQCCS